MAIAAFTDIVTLAVVILLMIWLNTVGYVKENGTYHVMAGVVGLYATGWLFNNGTLTYQSVYNGTTFVSQTVDANLFVVAMAVMTIASFLPIYFERYG